MMEKTVTAIKKQVGAKGSKRGWKRARPGPTPTLDASTASLSHIRCRSKSTDLPARPLSSRRAPCKAEKSLGSVQESG